MLLNVDRAAYPTVHVVLDAALLASTTPLAFHPAQSDKTICLSPADLCAFLKQANIEYTDVDFKELAVSAPAPAAAAPKRCVHTQCTLYISRSLTNLIHVASLPSPQRLRVRMLITLQQYTTIS